MLRHSRLRPASISLLSSAFLAAALAACDAAKPENEMEGPEPFTYDAPWPSDVSAIYSKVFVDGVGDLEALPPEMAGPPYAGPVTFPAVDVSLVQLGVDGDFLYMRVEYAGMIPDDVVHVAPVSEVEEQWVQNQGMNVAVNVDDDVDTGGSGEGVSGIDIFFAVSFDYGVQAQIYANYDFPDGDVHHHQHQVQGELGAGGPGTSFAVVRYDVSGLGAWFPRGAQVDVGSWSEGESFTDTGALLYHHFAFDRVIEGGTWAIPAE